eukprot:6465884-Amphidinium_carterae.2
MGNNGIVTGISSFKHAASTTTTAFSATLPSHLMTNNRQHQQHQQECKDNYVRSTRAVTNSRQLKAAKKAIKKSRHNRTNNRRWTDNLLVKRARLGCGGSKSHTEMDYLNPKQLHFT